MTEITELHTLAKCSRAWLSRRLQMNVAMCPIHFEHAAAIAGMHGREFQPSSRHVARPIGFFRAPIDGAPSAIFVEHGTPLCILYGVLTHELTHLWQWDHWPRQVARTLSEGLAMWVEYHALLDAGAIHAARHSELYDDPVYGLGFRIALAVETELGFDQVKSRLCDVASASVSGVG